MDKVKKFLKVQTEPCEHRPKQQVQGHPQVGRRRRKSRARRDGRVNNKDSLSTMTHDFPSCDRRLSGASGHSNKSDGTLTGPGSIVNLNPHVPTVTQAETLRQKAFAKLRMFNFSLNWDLQFNQCK